MTAFRPRRSTRLEAFTLAALVRVGLRCLSLRRVTWLLAHIPAAAPGRSREPVTACVDAARIAAARVAHPTCFFESLVAFGLLARRGYRAELHIGARRADDLESHAWVTVDGAACGPDRAVGYTDVWHVAAASAPR
jgi:hypothetical protein